MIRPLNQILWAYEDQIEYWIPYFKQNIATIGDNHLHGQIHAEIQFAATISFKIMSILDILLCHNHFVQMFWIQLAIWLIQLSKCPKCVVRDANCLRELNKKFCFVLFCMSEIVHGLIHPYINWLTMRHTTCRGHIYSFCFAKTLTRCGAFSWHKQLHYNCWQITTNSLLLKGLYYLLCLRPPNANCASFAW